MIPFKLLDDRDMAGIDAPFLKFDLIKIAQLMTKFSVIAHTKNILSFI